MQTLNKLEPRAVAGHSSRPVELSLGYVLCSASEIHWDHIVTRFQAFQIISPPLHHPHAFIQVFSNMGIGTSHLVALDMRQLAFDRIRVETLLVKYR